MRTKPKILSQNAVPGCSSYEHPGTLSPQFRAIAWCCLALCVLFAMIGPTLAFFMLTESGHAIWSRLREPLPEPLRRRAFVLLAVTLMFGFPVAGFRGARLVRRKLYDPFACPEVCSRCGHSLRHLRGRPCPECGAPPL